MSTEVLAAGRAPRVAADDTFTPHFVLARTARMATTADTTLWEHPAA